MIAESYGVTREVLQPQRDIAIPNPILNSSEDKTFAGTVTVLRDPDTGRYRLWHGVPVETRDIYHTYLATMESLDGVHFIRPHQVCETPEIGFGSDVIDRGKNHPDPASRYAYSYWLDGGLRILSSADGFTWKPLAEGILIKMDHDITGLSWDPQRERYMATTSTWTIMSNGSRNRRTTMMSSSKDLIHWEQSWYALTPSAELDEGEIQFYGLDGYLTRGSLRIAMVKVLRDDLVATGTEPGSFGRAHTSLAWSRDGRTWVRDRAMFFEPDDNPEAWDHAHAWVEEQLVIGDTVRLYYKGYKQGHKMNRFEERQIGLVEMPLDRYVARHSVDGMLKTVPIKLGKSLQKLEINANASGGQLRVQIRDASSGQVVPGMQFADCKPITKDGLRHPVQWHRRKLSTLADTVIQIEFEMIAVDLFAFEFI